MLSSIFRKLPAFKGKHSLARFLLKHDINEKSNVIVKGAQGLVYKLPNLKESIGFEIYVNGVYEPAHIRLLVNNIPTNGTLLDLGANIGSICIPVSKLRPDIKIIAVEASPKVFEYLRYNVEMNNCQNIYIENFALSDSDGHQVAFYSPDEKFGKGSMSPVFTKVPEYVSTITLDSLIDKFKVDSVGFIKIDVEGYEGLVFRGGIRLLSSTTAPPILFEFADWAENLAMNVKCGDSQRILLDFGYKIHRVGSPRRLDPVKEVQTSGSAIFLAIKGKF
jgi:FkbM family methyltransferase